MQLLDWLLDVRNRIDYPLRQLFQWRRGKFLTSSSMANEDPFAAIPSDTRAKASARASILEKRYHINGLRQHTSAGNYRENLFYLDMLDACFAAANVNLLDHIQVADIGPSHWFYVNALYGFLQWYQTAGPRTIELKGFEADAYRLYADFNSRYDHALKHINQLKNVTFIPKPFYEQKEQYDLVTMFFPFIFQHDHLEWGLPAAAFHPKGLLQTAWNSVKPGGALFIVNQGAQEHNTQKKYLLELGIPVASSQKIESDLFKYQFERYTLLCIK